MVGVSKERRTGMALITIPTVIFRNPIPTGEGYDIQGLLLAFGKYREAPGLTESEKVRLMQFVTTGEWLASGGIMKDGVWFKDGVTCCLDQKDTLTFIQSHYKGHQVSLLNVVYDRDAWGCCGLFCDILGSPALGNEIRDWVDLHGVWYKIEYFVSDQLDVAVKRSPLIRTGFNNDTDEDGSL